MAESCEYCTPLFAVKGSTNVGLFGHVLHQPGHFSPQERQRPAPAAKDAATSPDAGRTGSKQAPCSGDERAARRAGPQLQDGAGAGVGGTIDLNASSSSEAEDDVALVQPDAPRRSKPAFVEVMLSPSCVCLFSVCCGKTLWPR